MAAAMASEACFHRSGIMKSFPHHYQVESTAQPEGDVVLASGGLADLRSQPPAEFDGPGDRWSPETLLVGSMADCFALTFRAIARASSLRWQALHCRVEGLLERDQGVSRFTRFTIRAELELPAGANAELAERCLHKAEQGCLISNSLTGRRELEVRVAFAAATAG
jgi:organic hydroperoxide reductase OsmC/OhrA